MWNLVAAETREGAVFQKLLDKLEAERQALGGRVFDILGETFENVSLKDLLIEAIRYGEQPEIKARLDQVIDSALDTGHLEEIMRRNALVEQHMGLEELYAVKEEMEKAEARKLQPYFIRAFFTEAFKTLGGEMRNREYGRYEIRHVPAAVRERDRVIGETRTPVLKKYERICFEKQHIRLTGKPMADLIHPGHPLMHALTDLVLEAHRPKLKQGAVLVNPDDDGLEPNPRGRTFDAGWAPHLDLQPIEEIDLKRIDDVLRADWIGDSLESQALNHASKNLVPEHYGEVKERRERQVDKILAAVNERLVKEINYWSDRYIKLSEDVAAGKQPRLQPDNARRRVEELTARLEQRKKELEAMRNVVSSTPVVIGGALVIPQGLLAQRKGETTFAADATARARIEQIAMQSLMDAERGLGHQVHDVSDQKCGWDITSRPPRIDGKLQEARHIEVKGRAKGQTTITVTRNEIIYGLNQKAKFILAVVIVDGDRFDGPYYIRDPFKSEPDFGVASVNYDLDELLSEAAQPEVTVLSSSGLSTSPK